MNQYTSKKTVQPINISLPSPQQTAGKIVSGTISTIATQGKDLKNSPAKKFVDIRTRINKLGGYNTGGLAAATAKLKAQGLKKGGSPKKKKKFPDLSGDGKVTMKDILMARGVIKKKKTKKKGKKK